MTEDIIVARSQRAELVRRADGLLGCRCPYACMAVSEKCEFEDHPEFALQQAERRRRLEAGQSASTRAVAKSWRLRLRRRLLLARSGIGGNHHE